MLTNCMFNSSISKPFYSNRFDLISISRIPSGESFSPKSFPAESYAIHKQEKVDHVAYSVYFESKFTHNLLYRLSETITTHKYIQVLSGL